MYKHRYIDMDIVRNNPNKSWDKHSLSFNKQLTVKDIDTLVLPNSTGAWIWNWISGYINIKEVLNNPNKPWNKKWLSINEQLTVKVVETLILSNSKDDWDWAFMSSTINIQEIINNPNKPWVKSGIKFNKGITEKMLDFFDNGLLKHLQMNIYTFKYHTDIIVKCEY